MVNFSFALFLSSHQPHIRAYTVSVHCMYCVSACCDNVILSHYQVQVDSAAAKSTAKNQKALSGGERSFATVCFIMSLWDAIEAPFRVLDEFDVFMVRSMV